MDKASMDFLMRWMIPLSAAAFFAVCGIVLIVLEEIRRRRQKGH